MFKPSTLLKVVSILTIIGAALGLISTVAMMAMSGTVNDLLASMGQATLTTGDYIFSLVSVIFSLVAGIFGLMGKNKKATMGLGIVILIIEVISIVMTVSTTGFTVVSVLGLILPLLFIWGVYQSNEI